MIINAYPHIKDIALIIAYDNGMINRNTTEQEWLASLDAILGADGVDTADLVLLNEWCGTLSQDEKGTLAAGENLEQERIEQRFPKPLLFKLYNDIFEGMPQ